MRPSSLFGAMWEHIDACPICEAPVSLCVDGLKLQRAAWQGYAELIAPIPDEGEKGEPC